MSGADGTVIRYAPFSKPNPIPPYTPQVSQNKGAGDWGSFGNNRWSAWVDMHLVAASTVVIGTAGSTFSDMAGSLLIDGSVPLRAGQAWSSPTSPTSPTPARSKVRHGTQPK